MDAGKFGHAHNDESISRKGKFPRIKTMTSLPVPNSLSTTGRTLPTGRLLRHSRIRPQFLRHPSATTTGSPPHPPHPTGLLESVREQIGKGRRKSKWFKGKSLCIIKVWILFLKWRLRNTMKSCIRPGNQGRGVRTWSFLK